LLAKKGENALNLMSIFRGVCATGELLEKDRPTPVEEFSCARKKCWRGKGKRREKGGRKKVDSTSPGGVSVSYVVTGSSHYRVENVADARLGNVFSSRNSSFRSRTRDSVKGGGTGGR